ncbi:hypothetical protein [Sinomicrobium soli]|uniref:hypothetical protein n=1 Tax=Sinomicrobium sp. N-1-3-6 TaxID=2219864 RepID=UPI000DCE6A93|nr:hypothetical protein [Sinomicrobium sp. N-1-3-6]RAV30760.1 hypothetical protein DN748_00430 [Sinomicrobium sp. N-1-3-6]
MKKPFYRLKFSSRACNFNIRINDIPVFNYHDTGMISTQYPINHLILNSGEQKISMYLYPQAGQQALNEHSSLNMEIIVEDLEMNKGELVNVFEFKSPQLNESVPFFENIARFKAEVPHIVKGWSQSEELELNDSLEKRVKAFYQNVYSLLEQKKFQEYRSIYDTKINEIDRALYTSSTDTEKEWDNLINTLIESKMEAANNIEDSFLKFYGDKRVITLVTTTHEPVLFCENKEEKLVYEIELYLHKPIGSELEVIR